MKKSKKMIAAASAVIMLMVIAPVSVLARDIADKNAVVYNERNTSGIQSNSDEAPFSSETVAAKIDGNRVLNKLSLTSRNMQSFNMVDYGQSDIKYEAVFNDGSAVSFDRDMNIIGYSNFDRNSKNSQISNDDFINMLKQEYNIDKTYQLDISYEANESADDIKYYWAKTEKNGIRNSYDALSVRIDGITDKVVLFNRFNSAAQMSEIMISEEKAKRIALDVKEEFQKVTGCKKEYVKPNYFWTEDEIPDKNTDMVRLVYNVNIDSRFYVYIDAETGKVIGGDVLKCIAD